MASHLDRLNQWLSQQESPGLKKLLMTSLDSPHPWAFLKMANDEMDFRRQFSKAIEQCDLTEEEHRSLAGFLCDHGIGRLSREFCARYAQYGYLYDCKNNKHSDEWKARTGKHF